MNKEKIEASILLGSYLDTIGFKNGEIEFNIGKVANTPSQAIALSYINTYHYFLLGGINKMSLLKLKASDDTLLMIATGYAVLDGGGERNYIDQYIKWYPIISEPFRFMGNQTTDSILLLQKLIKNKKDSYLSDIPYLDTMGGNGAAIRTSIIGLKWYDDINKIIEESIIASRVTHNFPIGFLGGLITALFTSFAYNDIKPWKWIDKLLEIYENKQIINYIHSSNFSNTLDEEIDNYFYYWYKYKEERLINIMQFRRTKEFIDPMYLINMMLDYNSNLKKKYKNSNANLNEIGSSGLDSVILAYDCLLLSIVPKDNYTIDLNNIEYSWDSLVFFGCLHVGDTDSTGIILGSWYGALNGFNDINTSKLIELEFYHELKNIINRLI
jgi:ADP-ribosylarginine hydrolase